MESHALLRNFAVDIVETAGYAVIEACNAEEALVVLANCPHIALLITNVVMPSKMNGVELAHAVDARWPSVKVIVVTGKPGLTDADFPPKSLLFEKPYHVDELLFEIRSAMSAVSS